MIHKIYGSVGGTFATKKLDWVNDGIKVALLKSTYTPNLDTHTTFADVSAHEITGTGYTAGGQDLTLKTVAYDAANDKTNLGAANVTWPSATFTTRYAVLYSTVAGNPLVSLINFESDSSVSNATFMFQWAAGVVLDIRIG